MNRIGITPDDDPREQLARAASFARRALGFWPIVLVTILIGEVGCLLFLHFKPARFRSQIVLLYSETIRTSESGEPVTTPKSLAARMQEMLTARQKLGRVVEQFNLYPEVRKDYGMSEAVDEFRKHIEFRAPGGDTFTIAFEGDVPERARDVTARLAQIVIEQDTDLRKQQATTQRDFLSAEKKRAADRLKNAEQGLATFMAEHPRFALDATPLASGAAIRATVGQKTPEPIGNRTRLVAVGPSGAEKTAPTANPAPAPRAPISAEELAKQSEKNGDMGRARAALAAARGDLNDKLARYTDAHPDVRDARDAVRRAEVRVESLSGNVAPSSETNSNPIPTSAPNEAKTSQKPRYVAVPIAAPSRSGPSDGGSGDVVVLETDWSRLTMAVTEARQRHDQIESSLFKADIASSSANLTQTARVTVIDPAFLPQRPVPPGPRTIAALFLGFSLLAGLLLASGRAALDDRIFNARSAAGLIDVLVEIPRPKRSSHA